MLLDIIGIKIMLIVSCETAEVSEIDIKRKTLNINNSDCLLMTLNGEISVYSDYVIWVMLQGIKYKTKNDS